MLKPYLVIVEKEGMYQFIRSSHDTFEEAHEEAKSALEYFADALVHVAETLITGRVKKTIEFTALPSPITIVPKVTLNQVLGRTPKDASGCPCLWDSAFLDAGFKVPPAVDCSKTTCLDC